jgi:2-polyprenyl-3-methyl-5-hydroxy-6-metoxy-1,4-benzoquinol methylase
MDDNLSETVMKKPKQTRRHEDLDLFARVFQVFADTPWLHYGLWLEGEEPRMTALRGAQERYVDKLLALLPPAPAHVLDIGGGTGALTAELVQRGYRVDMLTPSPVQVEIARERLTDRATIHCTRFEDLDTAMKFDVCLFSESFQYIPLDEGLGRAEALLAHDGRIIIADCFRTPAYKADRALGGKRVGGGHPFAALGPAVDAAGLRVISDEDVTPLAAPTIALDRRVYREVVAPVVADLGAALTRRSRILGGLVGLLYRLTVSKRERANIDRRLAAEGRTPEDFMRYNTYRFMVLGRAKG